MEDELLSLKIRKGSRTPVLQERKHYFRKRFADLDLTCVECWHAHDNSQNKGQ